jgi:DNA replication and repair protein RecF
MGMANEDRPAAGVSKVTLEGFRNYASLEVDLAGGFNIIQGENAQGKTNFLEALHLLATTRLLRGIRDAEAILEGATRATCKAELAATHTSVSIVLERGVRKRAQLNGMSLPRASDILGRLPCVCSSLADMPIVAGEPSDRRLFLDLELSQLYTAYLQHLTLYKRALEQRNALLKASQDSVRPAELFDPWEEQIAHHGAGLRAYRRKFVEALEPHAESVHGHLGAGENLKIAYVPKDDGMDADALRQALGNQRFRDIQRGSTSVGPHRDDVSILVGDREARLFGSQGQQRTAVLALKMGTLMLGAEQRGTPPLLLLDDILADLDEGRRGRLIEWVIAHAGQAVLTCTEIDSVGREIRGRAKLFRVAKGAICEA